MTLTDITNTLHQILVFYAKMMINSGFSDEIEMTNVKNQLLQTTYSIIDFRNIRFSKQTCHNSTFIRSFTSICTLITLENRTLHT